MPCCVLIALFSQPFVLLAGFMSRVLAKIGIAPEGFAQNIREWRWLGITGAVAIEIVLASAAAPYVMAMSAQGADDLSRTVLNICSISSADASAKIPISNLFTAAYGKRRIAGENESAYRSQ